MSIASCIRCGRTRPIEDLITISGGLIDEACLEGDVKADARRDSIDAAWAAMEASMPTGYRFSALLLTDDLDAPADVPWLAIAELSPDSAPDDWLEAARQDISVRSTSPVRALRLLAGVLADRQQAGVT